MKTDYRDHPLIAGGQGRRDDELTELCEVCGFIVKVVFVGVLIALFAWIFWG